MHLVRNKLCAISAWEANLYLLRFAQNQKDLLAQVSILGPLGYEPNTLPLRQRAYEV